jgi:hypothetical protein
MCHTWLCQVGCFIWLTIVTLFIALLSEWIMDAIKVGITSDP